jgi:hypothetical protein
MGLWGIDFIGTIAPISKKRSRYLQIVVNYFTSYLFTKAVSNSESLEVVNFLTELSGFIGWPRGIYHDNGSNLVNKEARNLLTPVGVKQYPAPKSHPQLVGLAERYVQLVVVGLRTLMTASDELRKVWDNVLPHVMHLIKTKVIYTHG